MTSSLSLVSLYQPSILEEAYGVYLLQTVLNCIPSNYNINTNKNNNNTNDSDICLKGKDAVVFFSKSGLDRMILRTIWTIVDPDTIGTLYRSNQFYILLRFIALLQIQVQQYPQPPNSRDDMIVLLQQTSHVSTIPLARFDNIPIPEPNVLLDWYHSHHPTSNHPSHHGTSTTTSTTMNLVTHQQHVQQTQAQQTHAQQHPSYELQQTNHYNHPSSTATNIYNTNTSYNNNSNNSMDVPGTMMTMGSSMIQQSELRQQQQDQSLFPSTSADIISDPTTSINPVNMNFGGSITVSTINANSTTTIEPSGWDALDALAEVHDAPLPSLVPQVEQFNQQLPTNADHADYADVDDGTVTVTASDNNRLINNTLSVYNADVSVGTSNNANETKGTTATTSYSSTTATTSLDGQNNNNDPSDNFGDFTGIPIPSTTFTPAPTVSSEIITNPSGWNAIDSLQFPDTSILPVPSPHISNSSSTMTTSRPEYELSVSTSNTNNTVVVPMIQTTNFLPVVPTATTTTTTTTTATTSATALPTTSATTSATAIPTISSEPSGWDALDALTERTNLPVPVQPPASSITTSTSSTSGGSYNLGEQQQQSFVREILTTTEVVPTMQTNNNVPLSTATASSTVYSTSNRVIPEQNGGWGALDALTEIADVPLPPISFTSGSSTFEQQHHEAVVQTSQVDDEPSDSFGDFEGMHHDDVSTVIGFDTIPDQPDRKNDSTPHAIVDDVALFTPATIATAPTSTTIEPSGWDALDALTESANVPLPVLQPANGSTGHNLQQELMSSISTTNVVLQTTSHVPLASTTHNTFNSSTILPDQSGWGALDALSELTDAPVLPSTCSGTVGTSSFEQQQHEAVVQTSNVDDEPSDSFGDFEGVHHDDIPAIGFDTIPGQPDRKNDSTPHAIVDDVELFAPATIATAPSTSIEPSGWDALDALTESANVPLPVLQPANDSTGNNLISITNEVMQITNNVPLTTTTTSNAINSSTILPDQSGWGALDALSELADAPVLPICVTLGSNSFDHQQPPLDTIKQSDVVQTPEVDEPSDSFGDFEGVHHDDVPSIRVDPAPDQPDKTHYETASYDTSDVNIVVAPTAAAIETGAATEFTHSNPPNELTTGGATGWDALDELVSTKESVLPSSFLSQPPITMAVLTADSVVGGFMTHSGTIHEDESSDNFGDFEGVPSESHVQSTAADAIGSMPESLKRIQEDILGDFGGVHASSVVVDETVVLDQFTNQTPNTTDTMNDAFSSINTTASQSTVSDGNYTTTENSWMPLGSVQSSGASSSWDAFDALSTVHIATLSAHQTEISSGSIPSGQESTDSFDNNVVKTTIGTSVPPTEGKSSEVIEFPQSNGERWGAFDMIASNNTARTPSDVNDRSLDTNSVKVTTDAGEFANDLFDDFQAAANDCNTENVNVEGGLNGDNTLKAHVDSTEETCASNKTFDISGFGTNLAQSTDRSKCLDRVDSNFYSAARSMSSSISDDLSGFEDALEQSKNDPVTTANDADNKTEHVTQTDNVSFAAVDGLGSPSVESTRMQDEIPHNNGSIEEVDAFDDFGDFAGFSSTPDYTLKHTEIDSNHHFGTESGTPTKLLAGAVEQHLQLDSDDFGEFTTFQRPPEIDNQFTTQVERLNAPRSVSQQTASRDDEFDDFTDAFRQHDTGASSGVILSQESDAFTPEYQAAKDHLCRLALLLPAAFLRVHSTDRDVISISECFNTNIGAELDEERKSRVRRCLHVLDLLSSTHSELAATHWERAFIVARDELATGLSLFKEAKELFVGGLFDHVKDTLDKYVKGMAEFVKVIRNVIATIGDVLLLETTTLLTPDTFPNSWRSIRLLIYPLEIECIWKEIGDLCTKSLGLEVPDVTTVQEIRSQDSSKVHKALCSFTLQPLTNHAVRDTNTTVDWNGKVFMACSANFLANKCDFA